MTTTRFAPSPTGRLHIGNLRTAVMNWLISQKAGGAFILRIDDTDQERSTEEFADGIRRDLEWLGLNWDREEKQSDRFDRYYAAADRLREAGRLYDCFETPLELDLKRKSQLNAGKPPVYDRAALKLSDEEKVDLARERTPHQRFLLDQDEVRWTDLIRGDQRIDAASISDPVLFRADGQLLYTLASVVDDGEMGVTHVVRGADHVTNTGAQIQIFKALGYTAPEFAHHSLLTGAQGEALSKRLGTLALSDLREQGVEPLALVTFMARLGASIPIEPVTDIQEIIASFEPGQFNMSPTKFDAEELALHSAKTLRALPFEDVKDRLPVESADFWDAIGPNLDKIQDAQAWWDLCQNGAEPVVEAEDSEFVAEAMANLPPRPWTTETWGAWTKAMKESSGRKGRALFQPLRKALTGQSHGPDMGLLMPLLQKP
ncbi:MAG: glutamate--tRNA ligase [Pseudomonadota bacterium]